VSTAVKLPNFLLIWLRFSDQNLLIYGVVKLKTPSKIEVLNNRSCYRWWLFQVNLVHRAKIYIFIDIMNVLPKGIHTVLARYFLNPELIDGYSVNIINRFISLKWYL
jgi:hypothetical protein